MLVFAGESQEGLMPKPKQDESCESMTSYDVDRVASNLDLLVTLTDEEIESFHEDSGLSMEQIRQWLDN